MNFYDWSSFKILLHPRLFGGKYIVCFSQQMSADPISINDLDPMQGEGL